MEQITLKNGKKVFLSVNANSVQKVKDQLKISLLDISGTGVIEQLMDNPLDFCNVIYLLCKKSCEELKISAEEFAENMEGKEIQDATLAFIEDLVNFLPLHKKTVLRQSLKMVSEMNQKMMESSVNKMESMREKLSLMVESEVTKEMKKIEDALITRSSETSS